jgi:hypothetical protein
MLSKKVFDADERESTRIEPRGRFFAEPSSDPRKSAKSASKRFLLYKM